jgi:hypothetical protein
MNQADLRCQKCGAQKRIFWPKRLKVPMTVLFILTPIFFVLFSFTSTLALKAIFGIAGFVSLFIIIAFVKIRCLRCEPQWLAEAWGGENYEKQ